MKLGPDILTLAESYIFMHLFVQSNFINRLTKDTQIKEYPLPSEDEPRVQDVPAQMEGSDDNLRSPAEVHISEGSAGGDDVMTDINLSGDS